MSAPLITEICPRCDAQFKANPYDKGGSMKYKKCPEGHESSVFQLIQKRREVFGDGLTPPVPLVDTRRTDDLRAALEVMLAALEQAQRTFRIGSQARALLDGAFEKSEAMARKVLAA